MASPFRFTGALAALASAVFALALPVRAQVSGDGFLFREPAATLSLHGGYARADAASDLFSFSTERLTLGAGDFSGFTGGADLALRVSPRADLLLSAAYAGRISDSEFRDWVDDDDLPIEQSTLFERVPVSAGFKAYVAPRGRRVGSFAWIPARVAPYVGAAGGAMWYRFRQDGDFVDFESLEIFSDRLESSGWTPTLQALTGADISLTPRLALKAEARYSWAEAKLSNSFDQFDPIDLSGLAATIGLSVRF